MTMPATNECWSKVSAKVPVSTRWAIGRWPLGQPSQQPQPDLEMGDHRFSLLGDRPARASKDVSRQLPARGMRSRDIAAEGGDQAGGGGCRGVEGEQERTEGGGEQPVRVESGDRGCRCAWRELAGARHEVDQQVLDEEEPEEDGDEG